jgi:hypothetical protein
VSSSSNPSKYRQFGQFLAVEIIDRSGTVVGKRFFSSSSPVNGVVHAQERARQGTIS